MGKRKRSIKMFSGREVAVLTVKVQSFGANIWNHEV